MKNILLIFVFVLNFFYQTKAQTNANTWTWIKGSNTINQVSVYGTQGVANANNSPGSRKDCLTWVLNGKIYLMGGDKINGYLNDLWEYNSKTNNWTWLKGNNTLNLTPVYGTQGVAAAANTPGSRGYSVSWVFSGKLYLHGGITNSSGNYLNDLWEYNPLTNNWRWLKGGGAGISNQAGVYGTQGIAETFTFPGNRAQSQSWIANGKFYLFGGTGYLNDNYGIFNDLWEYNPATNNWRWLKGANTQSQLGIYGTNGIAAVGNRPGARNGSYTWVYNGLLYLMGGSGFDIISSKTLNDLWEYNPTTNNWRWLKGSSTGNQLGTYGTQGVTTTNNTPGGRVYGVAWCTNVGKIYIFGGDGLDIESHFGSFNDLWEYNPITNNWTWLKGSNLIDITGVYGSQGTPSMNNIPGGRDVSSSCAIDNKLYLIGGGGYDNFGNAGDLNDVWVYEPVCSSSLVFGFTVETGNYEALNGILTQNGGVTKIETGGNVTFSAKKSITLNPSFEVKAGSVFKAEIGGCN